MNENKFQYCHKIIIFSKDRDKVLLFRRYEKGQFGGMFAFVGGKMDIDENSIVDSLKREKDEEIGEDVKIKVFTDFCADFLFVRDTGKPIVMSFYFGIYENGEINLNDEHLEYKWVEIDELSKFEPKIFDTEKRVKEILRLDKIIKEENLVLI